MEQKINIYTKNKGGNMESDIILEGDALSVLKTLPEESVDMVMTSPPYWALRDYGVDGQLGLEPSFEEYISNLCDIFDEVKRVLKKEGSCWVNLGDTYSGNKLGNTLEMGTLTQKKDLSKQHIIKKIPAGMRSKSLCMIPERFAIEMINRGWILRNTIIWHKKNCMPTSAKDRFTVDFEKLFFFTKNKKYYFKQQFESQKLNSIDRTNYDFYSSPGEVHPNENRPKPIPKVWNFNPAGRNKRTVWAMNSKPYPEAHFAVYPEELCETPIKAGCPKKGVVLDPFFGSGTTGVVAKKQGKYYIGIELKKDYIEIAEKRLEGWKEQRTLKEVQESGKKKKPSK